MFSNLRSLAGRLVRVAIYLGLAFVGVILFVWSFVFALAVAGGLLLLFILMRVFGVRRPRPSVRGSGGGGGEATTSSSQPAGVIDLKRRDDGSYE